MLIDGWIGLDQPDFSGERVVVKVFEPFKILARISNHIGMHIRENGGLYAGCVNLLQPFDHVWIGMGPHLDIPFTKLL